MPGRVLIIGGGASGLMAAIAAARQGAGVRVLEHKERMGKKLLSTGNGKCNMTNLQLDEGCYFCSEPEFPMAVIRRFSVADTIAFFESIGILMKNKNNYLYPASEQAASVLEALLLEAKHLGVELITDCSIKKLEKQADGQFFAGTSQGNFRADTLVLAAGSQAAPVTGSDGSGYELARKLGHRIVTPLPALVALRCQGKLFKVLAGIRWDTRISLLVDGVCAAQETGELQLTDYGVSGIPTFQVSRFASEALHEGRKVEVQLDFFPHQALEETTALFRSRQEQLFWRTPEEFLCGVLPKKLAAALCKVSGIPMNLTAGEIAPEAWERFVRIAKTFRTTVTAANPFEQAQVCRGGVDTSQVCEETMQSRLLSGLYFAGELLDVDGKCGGYNLQWAWSSGYLAGISAAGAGCRPHPAASAFKRHEKNDSQGELT